MGIPPEVPVKAAKSIGPCPSYCRADCPGIQRPSHLPGGMPERAGGAAPGGPHCDAYGKCSLSETECGGRRMAQMGQNRPLDRSRVQFWGRLRRFGDLAHQRLEFGECRLVQIGSEKIIKSGLLKGKGVLVV